MNRRTLFKFLGLGAGAIAAGKAVEASPPIVAPTPKMKPATFENASTDFRFYSRPTDDFTIQSTGTEIARISSNGLRIEQTEPVEPKIELSGDSGHVCFGSTTDVNDGYLKIEVNGSDKWIRLHDE